MSPMRKKILTALMLSIIIIIIFANMNNKPIIMRRQTKITSIILKRTTLKLIRLIDIRNVSANVFICNITPDKYMEFVLEAYNFSSDTHEIIALSHNGEILWIYKPNISEFISNLPNIWDLYYFLTINDIDDIDDDGLDEILTILHISIGYDNEKIRQYRIYQIIDNDGSLLWRVYVFNSSVFIIGGYFFWSYDLDGDGHKEILVGSYYNIACYDAIAHEIEWTLNISFQNVGWPPIIDDINHDGKLDLIIANGYEPIFAIQGDGKILWVQHERVKENETCLLVYDRMLGDFTGDKKEDLLVWGMMPFVFKILNVETGKIVYRIEINYLENLTYWRLIRLVEFPQMGLDVNNDGVLELITAVPWRYAGVRLYNYTCISFRNRKLRILWKSFPLRTWSDTKSAFGDIDGDGRMEILVCPAWCVNLSENFSTVRGLVIINAEDGSLLTQYNLSEFGNVFNESFHHIVDLDAIHLADIDNDKCSELILSSTSIWSKRNASEWYWYINESYLNTCIAIFEISPGGFGSPWVNNIDLLSVVNKRATRTFVDSDYDGLPNYLESYYNASDNDYDTDNDKLPDGWEVFYGLNPANASDSLADFDDDGLNNLAEFKYKTSPLSPDTDGDGIPDDWEVKYGLNPKKKLDASLDFDHDGLSNYEEFIFNTNPLNPDTDGDGFSDYDEVISFSNPLDPSDFPIAGLSIRSWILIVIMMILILILFNICINYELSSKS